jgi:hypothetical protein
MPTKENTIKKRSVGIDFLKKPTSITRNMMQIYYIRNTCRNNFRFNAT